MTTTRKNPSLKAPKKQNNCRYLKPATAAMEKRTGGHQCKAVPSIYQNLNLSGITSRFCCKNRVGSDKYIRQHPN
jgi:hypothetical protein